MQQQFAVPADELARFTAIGRETSMLTVVRHARLAESMGLSGTDHKVLELIRGVGGPLTAGRIAELTGLSTGAVTGVVDRLERVGFVRRVRDTDDRRKVYIEIAEFDEEKYAPLFEAARKSLCAVLQRYSPQERATIERFQLEMLDGLRAEIYGCPDM